MKTVELKRPTDTVTRRITLCGTKPIMFDRYAGDNSTKLETYQKFYLKPGNTKIIGIPSLNLISLLSAHNTNSAPKRLRDVRQYKKIANACLSFLEIEEDFIPFERDGKPIVFGSFVNDYDELSGAYVHHAVARLEKGIPNPKSRPVLPDPWELTFNMVFHPNREIQEQEVMNLLEEAGRAIGLGTFRGVFGKYFIKAWD